MLQGRSILDLNDKAQIFSYLHWLLIVKKKYLFNLHMYVQFPQRPGEGVVSTGVGATDG